MTVDAWIAVGVVLAVFGLLTLTRQPAYRILSGGLGLLIVMGVVDPVRALAGFGNTGLVTVAVLFVVAAGLRQTGALGHLVQRALGRPRSSTGAQLRLVPPVVLGSAILNNTPLVAMLMPVLSDWCKTSGIQASKLLLPLSYAAILGGLCTLIGTSTNLVVNGLLVAGGEPGLGLFDIAWIGVPCAVVGVGFLLLASSRLLPDRSTRIAFQQDVRQYTVEMEVAASGPLVGKSIEDAGLRHLPGLYLMEIHRGSQVLAVVDPTEVLEAGDQLVFVGATSSVMDVQRIPGLMLATRQVFKLDSHRAQRVFAEAVVSQTCPMVGKTIREGRFRNRYDAVVIAVSRNGARVPGRLGDIELHAGDALLLETHPSFIWDQQNSRDFYLVSRIDAASPPTSSQAPLALAILAGMVVVVGTGLLDLLPAAILAAAAMLGTRCCSEHTARRSLDWPVLVTIGVSFGLGAALEDTGAAQAIAHLLLARAGTDPLLALVVIFGTATLLSELVTNNAAAVIVFPIAMSTAAQLQVSYLPFVMALMIAASSAFATPLGYQTNLMVYGPGGYRATDFLKMGLPMKALMWVVTCWLAPIIWPF